MSSEIIANMPAGLSVHHSAGVVPSFAPPALPTNMPPAAFSNAAEGSTDPASLRLNTHELLEAVEDPREDFHASESDYQIYPVEPPQFVHFNGQQCHHGHVTMPDGVTIPPAHRSDGVVPAFAPPAVPEYLPPQQCFA
jgi:hypothetical protein